MHKRAFPRERVGATLRLDHRRHRRLHGCHGTYESIEPIGGGEVATFEFGLVDELRVFRYPVVVGGGTPFLPPVTEHVPLDLIETRTFGSRVIYERYGRGRDESD